MPAPHLAKIKALWQSLATRKQSPEAYQPWADLPFRQWITEPERDGYNPTGNIYQPNDFGYLFNSEGLRCDELQPSDGDDLRILFTGCSFTFGVGLPVEHTFAHRLVTRLRNEGLSVPHWNIAFGGTSIDYSVRSLYQFLPRLKPDLVFALFPHHGRRECFANAKSHGVMRLINYLPSFPLGGFDLKPVERFYGPENEDYQAAMGYAFFETLMKAHACDYRWGNWTHAEPMFDEHAAVIPEGMMSKRVCFDHSELGKPPLARDLLHWGPNAHESMAETIYRSIPEVIALGHLRKKARPTY